MNPIKINIKCFQFSWVIWSNLYLGNVPLSAIAIKQIIKILIKITIYDKNLNKL